MGRDDDALARRVAREARRAAMRARDGGHDEEEDGMTQDGDETAAVDPVRAAREAARAAAMGAAVGAMRALTARRGEEQPQEGDGDEPDLERAPEPEPADTDSRPKASRRSEARQQPQATAASDVQRAVEAAKAQLQTLHGADAEGVSSFERTADGYRIVLASYAVEVDRDGDLLSYERVRRYQRSEAVDWSSS
jgi:hypothetical protein